MSERFTKPAAMALKKAKTAARRSGDAPVGSEHLLLGLLQAKDGTAAALLASFKVEEAKAAKLIDDLIRPASPVAVETPGEYTPRLMRPGPWEWMGSAPSISCWP